MTKSVLAVSSLVAVFCSAVIGCAPNAQGEEKRWESQQKSAEEFKKTYPTFTAVIDDRIGAARTAFTAASKEADAGKKAEQMKAANAIADDIVSPLNEVKYKSESIVKTIEKITALKLGKSDAGHRNDAVSAARNELAKVSTALSAARPATVDEAKTLLRSQVSTLIAAKGAADRALAALSKKKG